MGLGAGLYMYDVMVKMFTFAISSPVEFLVGISTNISLYLRNDARFEHCFYRKLMGTCLHCIKLCCFE